MNTLKSGIPESTTVKSTLKVKSYIPKSQLLDSTTVKSTLKVESYIPVEFFFTKMNERKVLK